MYNDMIRDSKRKKDLFNLVVILSKKCEAFKTQIRSDLN